MDEQIIAIDAGGTKVAWARFDGGFEPRDTLTLPSDVVFSSGLDGLFHHTSTWLEQHRSICDPTRAVIVIGVPGIISVDGERVHSCPNLTVLDGVDLKSRMARALGLHVVLANDVNLMTVAEHAAGAGQGYDHVACVAVGTGIGCGFVINDRLFVGEHGIAGEFGHTTAIPDGLPCTCGRRGCLEMYCSGKAFALKARQLLLAPEGDLRPDMARLLLDAAEAGDETALKAVREGFHLLGVALANLANIFDPGAIVVGGGLVVGTEWAWQYVERAYEDHRRVLSAQSSRLVRSYLGGDAALVGGAIIGRTVLERGWQ